MRLLLFIYLVIAFLGCKTKKTILQENGLYVISLLEISKKNLDSTVFRQYVIPSKIWIKDSSIIDERFRIFLNEVNGNLVDAKTIIDNYVFYNFYKKQFYVYGSFADTSKLIDVFSFPIDSSKSVFEFYASEINDEEIKTGVFLADTIIKARRFKRFQYFQTNIKDSTDPVVNIVYFDCSRKVGGFLKLFKKLSDKVGYPAVRIDYTTKSAPYIGSEQLELRRNYLTKEELKIFAAWEKYARENSVKK